MDGVGGDIDGDDADTLTNVSLIVVVMFMGEMARIADDDPDTLTDVSLIVVVAEAIALEEEEAVGAA